MDDKARKNLLEKVKNLLETLPRSGREEVRTLAILIGRGRKGDRVMELNRLWRGQLGMTQDGFANLIEEALIYLELSELKLK